MKRRLHKLNEKIHDNFVEFCLFLEQNDFSLKSDFSNEERLYKTYRNEYSIVILVMDIKDPSSYNKVFADDRTCFNKTGDCPFTMKIPDSNKFEEYLSRFAYWSSKEGKEISNKLQFEFWDHDST
jgi:hypothetical protein